MTSKTGLKTTFWFLTEAANAAADEILIGGLDSPVQAIRDQALLALLLRGTPTARRELVKRLPRLDPQARTLVVQHPAGLADALGQEIRSPEPGRCPKACDMVLEHHLYDAIPALVSVLQTP